MRSALVNVTRRLWRDPGFALLAMLSIGVGVGASTAVFSLTEQAIYRVLPVEEPERLALLSWKGYFVGSGWGSGDLSSYPLYRELSEQNEVFDALFCRHPTTVHFADGDAAQEVSVEIVSGTYFPALGVRPAVGRLLEPSDDVEPGAHPVIVVSFDFWRNRLGGDPDVVGRRVFVNGGPMTIVGVAAAGFHGIDWGEAPALWIPTMMKAQVTPSWDRLFDRRARWLNVFGRLKPGVTLEQAEASIQPWFKAMLRADMEHEGWPRIAEEEERQYLDSTLAVLPAARGRSDARGQLRQPFLALLGATGLILLLACLNVANLSLARALSRGKAIAMRSALGASRARIAGEQLVESAILAVGGAMLGLALAPAISQVLLAFLERDVATVELSAALEPRTIAFALAATVLTALVAGLAPALHSSGIRPIGALKEQASTVAGGLRLRKALVAGQICLALVLLVCAGLFVQTLAGLRAQGPGFKTANLLTFHLDLLKSGYARPEAESSIRLILDEIRALPDVERAGAASVELLTGGGWNQRIMVEAEEARVLCNSVTKGFFAAIGARLIAGRDFTERDLNTGDSRRFRSAIVNGSLAKKYLGDRDPIGARIALGSDPDAPRTIQIVGVVESFHYTGLRREEDQVYFPIFERPGGWATFYVRTRGSTQAAAGAIRAAVHNADSALPVSGMRTLDVQIDRALRTERMLAFLAAAFGSIATFLAVLGLYGVASFVAARRTREIGIRMALGSSRLAAQGLIVADAARLVALGVLAAIPATVFCTRLVESQLFGVRAIDVPTILSAAVLVAAASLIASAIPARRAAALNPGVALRQE